MRTLAVLSGFCFIWLAAQISASAATFEVKIEVLPNPNGAKVRVEGKIIKSAGEKLSFDDKRWTFLDDYADVGNLSGRFSNLVLYDDNRRELALKRIAPGEYQTDKPIVGWRYDANLEVPAQIYNTAHVSWLAEKHGLLMLGDLLPEFAANRKTTARIVFALPATWRIASKENKTRENEFSVADAEHAIFLVGNDFRESTGSIGKIELRVATVDGWKFSDEEIVNQASRIFEEHRRTFGEQSADCVQLILLPFPRSVSMERWRAETRGATIVLLSGVYSFKSMAINRLHEQLRHEIFHLWIPNALSLTGQYDWFYEGFTLYQALKTGVRLKYIRFEDYLDVMGRAFDEARFAGKIAPVSLLDASRTRWRGGSELVYAKGMVVAFLCDITLLKESGGKHSLTEVFRELYKKYRLPAAPVDGNAATLAILKTSPQLRAIVERFVERADAVDWTQEIAALGLRNDSSQINFTRLAVEEKLNGRQKNLLEKLGFKRETSASLSKKE